MSTVKCRTCQEPLESSWLFCEYCGKKTNKSDIEQELSIQNEINRKSTEDSELKIRIHREVTKLEPVSAFDFQHDKERIDPKSTTLLKARAQAGDHMKIENEKDSAIIHKKKKNSRMSTSTSTINETDVQTEKMISFLEEFNHSTMQKSTKLVALPKNSTYSFQKKIKEDKSKANRNKNKNTGDFFRSELEVKTSQNFNVITSNNKYLDHMPSLLDIFDDPSLLPKEEEEEEEEDSRMQEYNKIVSDKDSQTETSSVMGATAGPEPEPEPEQDIFFWGCVTQEGTTSPSPELEVDVPQQQQQQQQQSTSPQQEGDEDKEKEKEQSSALETAVAGMRLFQGGYWGEDGALSDSERVRMRERELEEQQEEERERERTRKMDLGLLSDEDEEEQHEDAVESVGEGDDDKSQLTVFDEMSETADICDVFEQLHVDVTVTAFNNERGRRIIANLYRSSMKRMNKAIEKGTIVFSRDPISQSRPVTLYRQLQHHLESAINEATLCIRGIDELYRMCHVNSQHRRLDVVARLETENKRAATARQKYSVQYAKVTNKEGTDVYSLELAQNRIREKAEKELDGIRIVVNDLLKEETDLIMKIKSEERSLELTVVMYSTKHIRLLEQTQVTHQSILSAKRWLAVRVIQRNVRFYLLPESWFGLEKVATPWFRSLLRQQTEMLRQQQLANTPKKKSRKQLIEERENKAAGTPPSSLIND